MNSSDRHNRAIELFQEACELHDEERAAFLEKACEGDRELQREVESLLGYDADPEESSQAAETGAGVRALSLLVSSEDRAEPTRVAGYEILRPLGSGGMGVVYEARQEHPRRIVALKLLRAGLETETVLKRFRREADLLGRLQHPSIAQVFDAGVGDVALEGGTQTRQPFLVMELVDGEPLHRYADERSLDPRQRLELFAKICDGVQHAHDQGVIHRDLKPDNILVTEEGQPKILDFGVSRATDADMHTVTLRTDAGQLIGTIPYMSPEQVLGDPSALDERSDVYSLGVVLFELLSGRLPQNLRNLPIPEAARAIREEEPTLLGTVDRSFRGDLETLTAKALEKDKSRRYASAAALASDIRRYLNHEPLIAKPPSVAYQFRKFAGRNKTVVSAVSMGLLLLVAGLIAATTGFITASRERDAKEAALREERAERETSEAVTAFVAEMLAATKPENQGREVTVREVMDEAARTLGEKFLEKPRVEARLRGTIGQTYRALGVYEGAEEQILEGLEVLRTISAIDTVEALDLHAELGRIYYFQGRYEDALHELERVADGFESLLEPTDVRLVSSNSDVGLVATQLRKYDYAERRYLHAREIQRKFHDPEDPLTLDLEINLATLYLYSGRVEEAANLLANVVEQSKNARGEDHPQTIQALSNLATARLMAGQQMETIPVLREVLERQRRVFGETHSKTLITLNNLGRALEETGQQEEAERLFREGLEISRATYGDADRSTVLLLGSLAHLRWNLDDHEEAEALYREQLQRTKEVYGESVIDTIQTEARLMEFYAGISKCDAAIPLGEDIVRKTAEGDFFSHRNWFRWRRFLASCYVEQGRFEEAESLLLLAYSRVAEENRPVVAETLVKLYDRWGRPGKAEQWSSGSAAE